MKKYNYEINPYPLTGGYEVSKHEMPSPFETPLPKPKYVGSLNVRTNQFEPQDGWEKHYRFPTAHAAAEALALNLALASCEQGGKT